MLALYHYPGLGLFQLSYFVNFPSNQINRHRKGSLIAPFFLQFVSVENPDQTQSEFSKNTKQYQDLQKYYL